VSARVFPAWLFAAVAFAIALVAFGLAQVQPGAGMVFTMAAAAIWAAYVVSRQRKARL
jgi:threonine/homoserine efflux transporter RhtA